MLRSSYAGLMTETSAGPVPAADATKAAARSGTGAPPATGPGPLSGRRKQAARNDQLILESARAVFIDDPGAPITAVAHHAGVGISALYNRYGSKEELLRRLCADGLATFVAETEAALADERDDWTAFAEYMNRLVDADTSSMTLALAGTFTPTEDMFTLAERANDLLRRFFNRFGFTDDAVPYTNEAHDAIDFAQIHQAGVRPSPSASGRWTRK